MKTIDIFDGEFIFLSNFYIHRMSIDGKEWISVEHYYQANKSQDPSIIEMIRNVRTPGKAKRKGNEIQLRQDWDIVKILIMKKALMAKFYQHETLKRKLLQTSGSMLIEGNFWHDNTWGYCYCSECKNKVKHNLLGYLLMDIRNGL